MELNSTDARQVCVHRHKAWIHIHKNPNGPSHYARPFFISHKPWFDESTALLIEVETDRIGSCRDCSMGIFRPGYSTDFDSEHALIQALKNRWDDGAGRIICMTIVSQKSG